jgi:RNA polymerase sigma-70 factor (ECF subfamily)
VETAPDFAAHDQRVLWRDAVSVGNGAGGDFELVRAACSGDLGAFERLYRSSVGLVYALCWRMSGDAARAEELTQDVFVRAWQKLATFRGESAFATWLTRLAVNVVLSERRDRGRRDGRLTPVDDLEALAPPTPQSPPGSALDLERAIAKLPEQARRVFVLHDVQGWGHAEIARATGLAIGTCKSHLHRARALLREVLKP